jgi:hypothetical protein
MAQIFYIDSTATIFRTFYFYHTATKKTRGVFQPCEAEWIRHDPLYRNLRRCQALFYFLFTTEGRSAMTVSPTRVFNRISDVLDNTKSRDSLQVLFFFF